MPTFPSCDSPDGQETHRLNFGNTSTGGTPSVAISNTAMGSKCIYIVGPSSSGKSTLCNAFATDVGVPPSSYIKEVARNVMITQGFTRADVNTFGMQSAIMTAQLQAEATIIAKNACGPYSTAKDSPVVLLSDRSAVDPIAYAASSNAAETRDMALRLYRNWEFEAALPRYKNSLFVLLTPVAEWMEDDGVRSLEDPWKYSVCLQRVLRELNIPFYEIGGETKEIRARVLRVKQWANL